MKKYVSIAFVLCMILSAATIAKADIITYHPINLSSIANSTNGRTTEVVGDLLLGGVPFSIPAMNNCWDTTGQGYGGQLISVDIPIGLYGVTEAHTLINTSWGAWGSNWVHLEFFGSDGAYYKEDMIGGDDIRDWAGNEFTNAINGVTSTCIWAGGSRRVDKQFIDLPGEFDTQTLTIIRMSDNGYSWSQGVYPPQRSFLYGMTVGVPEPATICLLGLGGLTLLRRKQAQNQTF